MVLFITQKTRDTASPMWTKQEHLSRVGRFWKMLRLWAVSFKREVSIDVVRAHKLSLPQQRQSRNDRCYVFNRKSPPYLWITAEAVMTIELKSKTTILMLLIGLAAIQTVSKFVNVL